MAIDRLLRARSIAIVGASEKVGPGFNAFSALEAVGFSGSIHLVNPGRSQAFGRVCHRSLLEVPGELDAAFIAVEVDKVLGVAREAAAKGAGGLAVLASGFAEAGEHGALLFSDDGVFMLPGYPTADVIDPTGAGDSFAGGIMGHLTADTSPPPGRLRRAMAYGTIVASLSVEGFGLERLQRTDRAEIDARMDHYRAMLAF